jgi:uncharacterized protein YcfJ
VRTALGAVVGCCVGSTVGSSVGKPVGAIVGAAVGAAVGDADPVGDTDLHTKIGRDGKALRQLPWVRNAAHSEAA